MSDSLRPHELQHARPPCPSPSPGVHSDSRPSSQWCHPAISSSIVPFSSCPQSLPASESFPVSQLFLHMRWPKYWSFSFSIILSKEHSGLIFRVDCLDLLAVQGTLKNLESCPTLLLRNGISVSSWIWWACNYGGSDPMWLVRLPHKRLWYSFHLVFQPPCSKKAGTHRHVWVLQTTALADILANGHKQWAMWMKKDRRWLQYPKLSGCMKNKLQQGTCPLSWVNLENYES